MVHTVFLVSWFSGKSSQLLPPEVRFKGLNAPNSIWAGALPLTLLAPLDPLAAFKGLTSNRERGDRRGRERKGRKCSSTTYFWVIWVIADGMINFGIVKKREGASTICWPVDWWKRTADWLKIGDDNVSQLAQYTIQRATLVNTCIQSTMQTWYEKIHFHHCCVIAALSCRFQVLMTWG